MKKLVLTFISFLLLNSVFCQDTFQKLVNSEYLSMRLSGIWPTDSCYYLTADIVDTTKRGSMFLKLNIQGEPVLMKTIFHTSGSYTNLYGDLISDENDFLKSGSILDSVTKTVIYKYSDLGDTIATHEYFGPFYPDLTSHLSSELLQKADGGVVVLSTHESPANNDTDISLLVTNPDFDSIDYYTYGTSSYQESSNSLLPTGDGGYILGGGRNNLNQSQADPAWHTYIVKTDSEGNIDKEYVSPPNMLRYNAVALEHSNDGGIIVASGVGEDSGDSQIVWDALVFKLDTNLNEIWNIPLRGAFPWTQTKLVEMVAASNNSGFVAVGKVVDGKSFSEPVPGSWLVKVSPEGDSLWSRYFSFYDYEYIDPIPYDLKQTPDGGYVVIGNTIKLGQPAPGWILKVDEHGCLIPGCHLTDSSEEKERPEIELAIYPNPTSDFLNFQLRAAQSQQSDRFRIVDTQGKVVKSFDGAPPGTTVVVPVSTWASGTYFLQYVENGEVRVMEKFVKQ